MSFLKGLAKGFVRSAVNQVGRDGGKVISNQVYGNKHSTPVRNAAYMDGVPDIPTVSEPNNKINPEYKPVYFDCTFIINVLILIGSIPIPIIGPLYWVLAASRNLFKSTMRYYSIEYVPVYVSDRRYKVGVRQTGVRPVKHFHESTINPSTGDRIFFIGKGIFALLISLAILYFQYKVYLAIKEDF